MKWKTWNYWLKGAIILGFLGFLIAWGSFVVTSTCTQIVQAASCSPFWAMMWPFNILAGIIYGLGGSIIGAVIGLIVGKVKSKQKNSH